VAAVLMIGKIGDTYLVSKKDKTLGLTPFENLTRILLIKMITRN
jgi:hypothetical protein